jgi:diaminohydroxyphosphoribosylaminopyrimidine deaminase/5-amino-6-(5-phosphoribosylamino)uracil reductase
MTNEEYMQLAMRLAQKGRGKTSPNPMVGAVIVKNHRIIAQGWHQRCGGLHAEAAALRHAGGRAAGASMYVTLEPCFHFGRTPPCVDQVIASRIKEVFMGMRDPNPLTNGKSAALLRKAGIRVHIGLLQRPLEKLNEAFIKYMKHRIPFVVAKTAQTLDGKIATAQGQSQWITSAAARRYARGLRNEFDAIIVGINTVLADDPLLEPASRHKRLQKVILDSRLRVPLRARLLREGNPRDCIIATSHQGPPDRIRKLEKRGACVLRCPVQNGKILLKWLLEELARREITAVLIEGGAQIIGSALRERLVDKMRIFVAPKIIGSQQALSAIDGMICSHVDHAVVLRSLTLTPLEKDWMWEGYCEYPKDKHG